MGINKKIRKKFLQYVTSELNIQSVSIDRDIQAVCEKLGINCVPGSANWRPAAIGLMQNRFPELGERAGTVVKGRQKRHWAKKVSKKRVVRAAKATQTTPDLESQITEFYSSWEWSRLRYDFLKDRKRICACCGATPEHGVRIVCDHIKPIRFHWHLRLERNNLQLLCDPCNMGKGSRDTTDWRAVKAENVVEFSQSRLIPKSDFSS